MRFGPWRAWDMVPISSSKRSVDVTLISPSTASQAARSSQTISASKAQNCGNILWAYARRGRGLEVQGLAQAVAQHASKLTCDEQSLASCVWALAVLGQRTSSLPLLRSVTRDIQVLSLFAMDRARGATKFQRATRGVPRAP